MSVWDNLDKVKKAETGFQYLTLCNPTETGCDCGHHVHDKNQAGKQPISRPWDLSYTRPLGNAGILVGKEAGIVVFDVDNGEQASVYQSLNLPETLTHSTGRGHHYFFNYVDGLPGTYKKVLVRGGGNGGSAYVVAPDSVHYSGTIYVVEKKLPVADLPSNVLDSLRKEPTEFFRYEIGRVPDGEKHTAIVSMNGTLRNRGVSTEARVAMLKVWAQIDFDTCPSDEDIRKRAEYYGRNEPCRFTTSLDNYGGDYL